MEKLLIKRIFTFKRVLTFLFIGFLFSLWCIPVIFLYKIIDNTDRIRGNTNGISLEISGMAHQISGMASDTNKSLHYINEELRDISNELRGNTYSSIKDYLKNIENNTDRIPYR